jgi:protein-tyrosine-phosphatase
MKRVLFVCRQNAGRSQMAQAFAEMHGDGCLLAYSAGSEPAQMIHPEVVEAMSGKGIDLSGKRPRKVTDMSDLSFDVVITMGCGDTCQTIEADHRLDWNVDDPAGLSRVEIDRIRDQIEGKVIELVRSLKE